MFKLSTRSSYGLRACLALAATPNNSPQAVTELSKVNQIPKRYLEQILNTLRHHGLVDSTRGAKGGYLLAKQPSEITVGDIVRAVEGHMEPILCSVPELKSGDCRTSHGCMSRRLCHELESAMTKILDGTNLDDLRLEGKRLQESSTHVALSELLIPKKLDKTQMTQMQEV